MGKYFTYAIGEILLVVIGILIALQINNWNENKKQKAKTQTYYHQLLEDLNKDKISATQTIAKFEAQRQTYNNYLKSFNEANLSKNDMYEALLQLNLESFGLDFNTSTIDALQNSGEIVLIPPVLRNKLVDLKRRQEKISRDESLDNKAKTGVTERLTMLMGAISLEQRLANQQDLKSSLGIEKNKNDIIIALDAVQGWMDFSELKSIRLLKELKTEIVILENLIKAEMNNQ